MVCVIVHIATVLAHRAYGNFIFSVDIINYSKLICSVGIIGTRATLSTLLLTKKLWQLYHPCIIEPRSPFTWARKMTSSNKNIFRVTDLCAGNSPVTCEFPAQRPVTRSFGVFFDLRLNKRLSKQSWGWWFETPLHSLWHHRNESKSK